MIIKIKKSNLLNLVWLLASSACIVPILFSGLNPVIQIVLLASLLVYSAWRYRHMASAAVRFPVSVLRLCADRHCILEAGKHEYHVDVVNHWCPGQWCLLSLGSMSDQSNQKLILAPDVITEQDRRYLRRWLNGYEDSD